MRQIASRVVSLIVLIAFSILILSGCAQQSIKEPVSSAGSMRSIVDMAGRTISVPNKINKVYAISPPGTILLYTMVPDKLIGWNYNYQLTAQELKYILPQYRNLPVLGSWGGQGATGNVEEILKCHPDVLVFLTLGDITEANIEMADSIEKQTKIPVVIINGSLKKMDQAFEFAGKLLNQEERAAVLAEYCRETFAAVNQKKDMIPHKKKVYYAESINGLESDPRGSGHVQVLDLVGGYNVVGTDVTMKGSQGRVAVSFEQVLLWNPEIIIVGFNSQEAGYASLLTDEKWGNIQAVRDKQVYTIPNFPFCWFDRPPSLNTLIGMRWLGNLLYPDVYDFDMKAEVKRFYALFYHYQLSDQEAEELLNVKQ